MSTQTMTRRVGPYALLVPSLVILAIAMGYPLVRQVVMSFQEYGRAQQFGQPAPFVGLDNYVDLFTDAQMWAVVGRSLAFCAVNVAVTMLLGIAIALLLRRVSRGPRLTLQIAMLLAWAMPVIAAMTSWQWLFDTRYGVINWTLVKLGFESFDGHNWLTNPWSFYFVATVIVVWMSVPFVMFTVYAALTQVSEDALEAGELDGASPWQRFRHIVYPTIRPVLTITLLLQVVWDLRVFAQIYYLQGVGGTPSKTHLLGTYIYTLGIGQSDYGMASALAMFVLVLTLVLTAGYVRALLRESR
ncbi:MULTISPECIES: carbohydrate ABC transporter permease [Aeromicrobium]|uniref:N,N'-diacetylchitobiose transport system permease protein n=2 Tax=Aeromicrobium tamlense TaxID=375541 RepID=A0ABX2SIN7_9ACTN|nr:MULTISPECIES: sugar ABC transporter permease [Aeromicrobium]NYI38001.1 N,N'-diacetylchitobiose transport system permease protein [Aeromicrobium tamlense]